MPFGLFCEYIIRVSKLKCGGKMGQPESTISVPNPKETPKELGLGCESQPPPSSPTPDPDPNPTPFDPHQKPPNDTEQFHEELQEQLDLKDKDKYKASHASNEDEEKEEEESEGEDNKDENLNENEKAVGDEEESQNGISNGSNNSISRHQYPVRPEAEDCAFYMKTGSCKFGANCKFNHPVSIRRKNQKAGKEKEKVKEMEETTEKPGQTECKYYLKTGGCKYGKACRYNHSRAKSPVLLAKAPLLPPKTQIVPILELNFLGLPIRPGERECPYYMRNGSCKYGANCRFNHPDPTTVGGNDPPSAFGNGGSAALQGSSQSSIASWSSPRALNEPAPFVPLMFPPTHGVHSQSPEWNGYQSPVYPPERSMHPMAAYVISSPTTETNVYAHHQQQMLVDEFPERPGQPDCSYFLKTGDCKFKSNCKYHHPKDRISKSSPCPLSDKGLPLRPDQNICTHYSRYGICKFGPACKFHHPEHQPSSTESGDDQSTPAGNSVPREEARMADSGNGSNVTIQQSV